MILDRRGNSHGAREKILGEAPLSQACALKPRAVPQLPSGWRTQDLGHRPQNSPGHDSVHRVCCEQGRPLRCGTTNRPPYGTPNPRADLLTPQTPPAEPRTLPGRTRPLCCSLCLQEVHGEGKGPPGATAEFPSAPSWAGRVRVGMGGPLRCASQAKPRVQGAVPSLTSQAAAQVAIQALLRSDRDPGSGMRAAGALRVSPTPSGPWPFRVTLRPRVLSRRPHRPLTRTPDCM